MRGSRGGEGQYEGSALALAGGLSWLECVSGARGVTWELGLWNLRGGELGEPGGGATATGWRRRDSCQRLYGRPPRPQREGDVWAQAAGGHVCCAGAWLGGAGEWSQRTSAGLPGAEVALAAKDSQAVETQQAQEAGAPSEGEGDRVQEARPGARPSRRPAWGLTRAASCQATEGVGGRSEAGAAVGHGGGPWAPGPLGVVLGGMEGERGVRSGPWLLAGPGAWEDGRMCLGSAMLDGDWKQVRGPHALPRTPRLMGPLGLRVVVEPAATTHGSTAQLRGGCPARDRAPRDLAAWAK